MNTRKKKEIIIIIISLLVSFLITIIVPGYVLRAFFPTVLLWICETFLDGFVPDHIFLSPEKIRILQDSCTSYFITKKYGTVHDVDHTLCVENK